MGKPITADDLSRQIELLEKQFFNANVHFELYMGLARGWNKHIRDIQNSPVFWQFTMKAHIDAAVVHLCRVYDSHKRALQISKFLQTVEENSHLFCESEFRRRHAANPHVDFLARSSRTIDLKQLSRDQAFCSRDNPLIKNLRMWRNNFVAHFNFEEALNQTVPMDRRHPLLYEHIKALIDGGHDILNRYSSLLDAKTYSDQFLSPQRSDYSYVLQSLRFARIGRNWNDRRKWQMIRRTIAERSSSASTLN
jgi:hypothetical protein